VILKTGFSPRSMWPYVHPELALGAASALAAWLVVDVGGVEAAALPAALATVLGTALAILLAVRANTSYSRWWEASGIWAQVTGLSRNLVRVATAIAESKEADRAVVRGFTEDVARRQIAFAHALRARLREDGERTALAWLPPGERARAAAVDDLPLHLLGCQSARILAAYGEGLLAGLENFQLEVALAGLTQQQALAERMASQPTPRTYDVFSRYLVHLFVIVFPFTIVATTDGHAWIVIPATLVVAFAFRMIERIGTVVERPFAGTVQDVPMSAICTELERDLLEIVGVAERPPRPEPVGGYLM